MRATTGSPFRSWLAIFAGLALLASLPDPVRADALPPPQGPVLLEIAGKIDAPNGTARLDLAGLEGLGLRHLRTSTYWTEGIQDFEGVLLRDLLRAVGAHGQMAVMFALNDYTVDIPVADAEAYDVLIAVRQNGAEMPIRSKGPLWIIYPIDEHPELDRKSTSDKMIWQLSRIVIN